MDKNPHAVALGSISTAKKARSSRANGQLGGRPRKVVTADYATEMAGMWLHRGNLAMERGRHDLAERHYAIAQVWQDRMNSLLGNH